MWPPHEYGGPGLGLQPQHSFSTRPRRNRPPMLPLTINTRCANLRAVRSLGSLETNSIHEKPEVNLHIINKKVEATSFLQSPGSVIEVKQRDCYVDKATDTADLDNALDVPESCSLESCPYEEVLPLLENLVIQLIGDIPNPPLERIYEGFRNGPSVKRTLSAETTSTSASTPLTPIDAFIGLAVSKDSPSGSTATVPGDVFTAHDPNGYEMMHGAVSIGPAAQHGRLPTPPYELYLPATPKAGQDQRFQSLSVRRQTETSVQNTLRLILSSYIPSEVWTQYPSRSPSSKAGTPWRPVLWRFDPEGGCRSCKELDMILAIGSERGVKQNYTSAIINQVEKLGLVSGETRSGRLDLRYLIGNAMQSFTSLPLTKQTSDSPFANSTTLANLLLPHLETYLSAHPQVRFLILEYPADHLPTVLALRKLVGSETVKVAGITSSDIRPSTTPSGSEKYVLAELRSVGGLDAFNNPISPKTASIPFTKANYILTSSATRTEISGFVAAIRDTLISRSDVYGTTESSNTTKKPFKAKGTISHLKQQCTFLSTSSTLDTPPASPRDFYCTAPQSPIPSSSTTTGGLPSIIPSTTTSDNRDKLLRGGLFLGGTASRLRSLAVSSIRSKNASRVTVDEMIADDHEFDDEERRLLPMYLRREAEKGNSEKAMRLLGLS